MYAVLADCSVMYFMSQLVWAVTVRYQLVLAVTVLLAHRHQGQEHLQQLLLGRNRQQVHSRDRVRACLQVGKLAMCGQL